MARDSAVLQFRADDDLKQAFTEAARQSRLVAQAPDEEESMDLLQAVQGLDRD